MVRLIREGTTGTCPKCGSTELKKYEFLFIRFGENIGCIQPKCDNFFDSKQKKRGIKLNKLLKR